MEFDTRCKIQLLSLIFFPQDRDESEPAGLQNAFFAASHTIEVWMRE
jgi:hypothetical protein